MRVSRRLFSCADRMFTLSCFCTELLLCCRSVDWQACSVAHSRVAYKQPVPRGAGRCSPLNESAVAIEPSPNMRASDVSAAFTSTLGSVKAKTDQPGHGQYATPELSMWSRLSIVEQQADLARGKRLSFAGCRRWCLRSDLIRCPRIHSPRRVQIVIAGIRVCLVVGERIAIVQEVTQV